MTTFRLFHQPFLQGEFVLQKINLALVFQVNCPGCFMYSIPMMASLFEAYHTKIGFLGLSTCFEDFDKNTSENTSRLLTNGEIVGETKKALASKGMELFKLPIKFPVAFDEVTSPQTYVTSEEFESLMSEIPGYHEMPEVEAGRWKNRVKEYFLSLDSIAKTFTVNHLKGTPSLIIFDDSYRVVQTFFGHVSEEKIKNILLEN